MSDTAIIVLAAGGSSRMGKPKLAEKYKSKTLLARVLEEVSKVSLLTKVVVLGGHKEVYVPLTSNSEIEVVLNSNWNEGISSSIKTGLDHVTRSAGKIDSVIILLADMVFVDRKYLDELIQRARESDKGILASDYGPSIGPPALFRARYFDELLNLKGDKGAKSVILAHSEDLELIEFPAGLLDVDTEEDLGKLHNRK